MGRSATSPEPQSEAAGGRNPLHLWTQPQKDPPPKGRNPSETEGPSETPPGPNPHPEEPGLGDRIHAVRPRVFHDFFRGYTSTSAKEVRCLCMFHSPCASNAMIPGASMRVTSAGIANQRLAFFGNPGFSEVQPSHRTTHAWTSRLRPLAGAWQDLDAVLCERSRRLRQLGR